MDAGGTTRGGRRRPLKERWVLIAGGFVIVALVGVLMATTASVDSFLYLGLDTLKRRSFACLGPDVTAARRLELLKAFDTVIAGATAKRIDDEEVGVFARACRAALADGRITAAEAEELCALARSLGPRAGR
jgi:hypothetical protein